MRVKQVLAIAVIAASGALGYVQAQAQVPAEFPPASYTGRQYVDSQGCVFVRAGIDGSVTWVPRVSRNRKQVCGARPSMVGSGTTTAAAAPKPAAKPEIITVPAATAAATAPPKVVKPQPKPAKVKRTTATVAAKPKAASVARPAPKVVTAPAKSTAVVKTAPAVKTVKRPAPTATAARSTCTGGSAISSRYMSSSGHAVRCGPQTAAHRTTTTATYASNSSLGAVRTAPAMAPAPTYTAPAYGASATYVTTATTYTTATYVSQPVYVAPRRVYNDQIASTQGIHVPEGYQPVWTDDRLNPHRAHQTFAGMDATDLVWTNTVPRRLINRKTGRVVSRQEYAAMRRAYPSQAVTQNATVTATAQPGMARNRSIHARYKTTSVTRDGVVVSTRSVRAIRARISPHDRRFDR